jgi:Tetracyclin repressor-like, C-terminal domain
MLRTDDGAVRADLVGSQLVGLVMTRSVITIEPHTKVPTHAVAAAVAPTIRR